MYYSFIEIFLLLDSTFIAIMSDDEVMGFEITEDDINNEFNFDLRRPRISKNRATYGIWAENSDEEDGVDSRYIEASKYFLI